MHARGQVPVRETADAAVLELYTLEAIDGRLLTGPYSRFGWHHPGPLYLYLVAPLYAAAGRQSAGMQVGVLVINVGALVVAVSALSTIGATFAIPAVVALTWLAIRADDMLVSVWNPHVIVMPLAALLAVASAFAATGRRAFALWLVVLGSFLVQTHIAMAPIVAVTGGLAAARHLRQMRGRFAATLLAVAAVLWLPVIVEQLTHRPGNLTRIIVFFTQGAGGRQLSAALGAWSSMVVAPFTSGFRVPTGADFAAPMSWPAGVAIVEVVAVAAAALVFRRRDPAAAWLATMCAAATIAAFPATIGIREHIVDHEVFWMSVPGAMNAGVLAGTALAITRWRLCGRRWVAALAVAAVAGVGVAALDRSVHRNRQLDDHAVDVLVDRFVGALRASGASRPLVHIDHPIWQIAAGALLQLRKGGYDVAVDERWTTVFGEAFEPDGREDVELTLSGTNVSPHVIVER